MEWNVTIIGQRGYKKSYGDFTNHILSEMILSHGQDLENFLEIRNKKLKNQ